MKPDIEKSPVLRGLWPPVLIESDSRGRVDLNAVAAAVRYFANAGVPGVYTADTASEFYTFEFDEWDELAGAMKSACDDAGLPAGIGCTWTNQAGSLRRIARARELGFANIHLSQPYWIRLNETAQRNFWTAVAAEAGPLEIVVYAGSQGQLPLDGPTLRRLVDCCPAIRATKTPAWDSLSTSSLFFHCPEIAHFVHEQVLAFWYPMGAVGAFSNLVCLAPGLALDWFALLENAQWSQAFEIQKRVMRFYEEGAVPLRKGGYSVDKPMAVAGGVPGATRTVRSPYAAAPDGLYADLVRAAEKHLGIPPR